MRNNDILNLLDLQEVLLKKQKFSKYSIELWIECPVKLHFCPSCASPTSKIHDYRFRSFNHINVGKRTSRIYYNQRRYKCKHCGKEFAENNTFIEKYYRHSNSVVNNIFDDLTTIKNFSQIGQDNNMSSQNVSRLMNKFMLIIVIYQNLTNISKLILNGITISSILFILTTLMALLKV